MGTGQLDKGLKSLSAMLNRGFEGTVYFGVDDGNVNYQVQFRKTSCYRDSYGIFIRTPRNCKLRQSVAVLFNRSMHHTIR